MRKIPLFIMIYFFSFAPSFCFAQGIETASLKRNGDHRKIDERIWSMSYWQRLAEQGLVPFNTQPADKKPIFTAKKILPGFATPQDSTDFAVISATNTTQSENSVFIDPQNSDVVLNSNNSSNWPVTTIYGASHFHSTNTAQTWQGSTQGAGGANRGDPSVAIDRSGRFYVGYIAADRGQGIARSTDSGQNWTSFQVAVGPTGQNDLLDKNHLWIDNSSSSSFQGNLYIAWTRFEGGSSNNNQIEIVRSTNQGANWSAPINISAGVNAGSHNQGVNIQSGPNGEVYAAWAIYDVSSSDETAIGFASSTDGGVNWSAARRIQQNIRGIRRTLLGGNKTMRVNSFPSMTVDNQGNIYVVWANIGIPGTNTGDPDIYMIKSQNQGSQWSTPLRINRDTLGNGRDQWFPWIAADPVTGSLACIFYDSRNFSQNDMAETFVAISQDQGTTWQDLQVSDFAWPGDGIVGFSANYAGDYLGIDLQSGKIYPVWSDDRAGNMLAYVSPLSILEPCNLPSSGDWTVSSSCEMSGAQIAPANVIVKPNAVLTIADGASLNIDQRNYSLRVEKDGGVLIRKEGKIY